MISVVCVFNNAELLERRLLRSLAEQSIDYELLCVDNRNNAFDNAATALNSAARQAKGEWILFAHQDVELLSPDWLSRAEYILQRLSLTGWVGVAGRTQDGEHRGFLRNCAALQGLPFENAVEVQTLDELLLIHKRDSTETKYFDDSVPGWHGYGVEACCSALRKGLKNYAVSLAVWHDSPLTNLNGLRDAHEYVWQKHGTAFEKIHTTCGVLPEPNPLWDTYPLRFLKRAVRRTSNLRLLSYGFRDTSLSWFHETMDSLTETSLLVQCLHSYADQDPIEACGFGPQPVRSHPIIHRFSGVDLDEIDEGDIVVAPDAAVRLIEDMASVNRIRRIAQKFFVCLRIADLKDRAARWRELKSSAPPKLTIDSEGVLIGVLDLSVRHGNCNGA